MIHGQCFMRITSLVIAFITCAQGCTAVLAASDSTQRTERRQALASPSAGGVATSEKSLAAGYGRLPLMFESNRGQVASGRVKFISRGKGYTLFLTSDGAVMSMRPTSAQRSRSAAQANESSVVSMKLAGVSRSARLEGQGELAGKVNYIRGRDPRSWLTGIETYDRIHYRGIYDGVDMVYYGEGGNLEYDFIVAPGADPKIIRFKLRGGRVSLNGEGELVLRTRDGEVTLRKPFLYQDVGGERREVRGGYTLSDHGVVRFSVGRYDRTKPLVIDPVLSYASFFGGEFDNSYETDIAVDSQGSAYVVGYTSSPEAFPTTPGAFRRTDAEQDGETFVAKLTPDGSAFAYSTFIGSAVGRSIAVDAAGNAYVIGIAGKDFPVRNGFQTVPGESASGGELVDAFVAKLNPTGSDLLYSSFIGGNDADIAFSVAADAQGNAYVSGETSSTNFPVTQGAARTIRAGDNDSFITKINTNASGAPSLVYSTFADVGRAVALDSQGNAYAAGNEILYKKQSVIKLNPTGTAFIYKYDVNGDAQDNSTRALWYAKDIAVDASGSAYITGSTATTSGAFQTPGGFQTSFGGGRLDAFLAKLDASGAAVTYATYLGGGGNEVGRGVSVDATGRAYVTGNTTSQDFPLRDALQPKHNGGVADSQDMITFETGGPSDAFVSKMDTTASGTSSLIYSTYYGFDRNETGNSIAVDSQGSAYVLGGLAPFGIPGIIHTPGSGEALAVGAPAEINRSGQGGHIVVKIAGAAFNTFQFAAPAFSVNEGGRAARITVTRLGDTSTPAGVEYLTLDGEASARSDYTSATGTLRFAPGETAKSFDVLITDDAIHEGDETAGVALLNPSTGFALGAPLSTSIRIADNDTGAATSNPVDDSQFFVRQHYLDFLGREPDAQGLQFWTNQIESCGADVQCREVRRINVSAAFFLSIEFQETGFYVIRAQRVAFGRKSSDLFSRLTYREFIRAARSVGEGVVVGEAGASARLEANKQAYAENIVAGTAFAEKFPASLSGAEYVAALFSSADIIPTDEERQAAVAAYGGGGSTGRVAALRSVSDSASVRAAERDTAFVLLQYLGYLRRDPDQKGYDFWLTKLVANNGNFIAAEMVKAFITSDEYRQRFAR
ncbi:MAG: SBBP repeat-containing protein [Pyrinomonadaceae bacterium]